MNYLLATNFFVFIEQLMSCGKTCEKLWENYLNKYGDFRERARAIINDRQCFEQIQLPRLQRSSLPNNHKKKSSKICDPLLPLECCHSLSLNKIDRVNLEKLIQAENFPENIFSNDTQLRSSIDQDIIVSTTDHLQQESSIEKSELVTSLSREPPTAKQISNPYAQWLKRMHQTEKTKQEHSYTELLHSPSVSMLDESTHHCLEQFVSFLHLLDDTPDYSIDKQTLITLFSLDNHLSSSIDIPIIIQPMNLIPKTIFHSLENTPIFKQLRRNTPRKIHRHSNRKQSLNETCQKSYYFNQDNELHLRLSNTSIIKAFKEYLIEHHRSFRLPKLFDDLDRYSHQ